jgi:hypothetical protein
MELCRAGYVDLGLSQVAVLISFFFLYKSYNVVDKHADHPSMLIKNPSSYILTI